MKLAAGKSKRSQCLTKVTCSMLHPSTKKLIDRLAEMTASASLAWEERPPAVPTYTTEGYTVTLSENPVELLICDRDGMEVERATTSALTETPWDQGGTYADLLTHMRVEALRLARGTETAISKLLEGLDDADSDPEANAASGEALPDETDAPSGTAPDAPVAPDEAVVAADTASLTPSGEDDVAPASLEEPAAEPVAVEDPIAVAPDRTAEAEHGDDPLALPLSAEETEVAEAVAKMADTVNGDGSETTRPAATPAESPAPEAQAPDLVDTAPQTDDRSAPEETPFAYIPFGLGQVLRTDIAAPIPSGTEVNDVSTDEAAGDDDEVVIEQVQERILIDATDDVIDATDDVLDFHPAEADWPSAEEADPLPSADPAPGSAPPAPEATETEAAPLARPRFNPWT